MEQPVFHDRLSAGQELAKRLEAYRGPDTIVLAIPRGGVPVGFAVAKHLAAQLDVIIPRKIPIPWNPEAGFGAVTADGTLVLNDQMVEQLGLSKEKVSELAAKVQHEIKRRLRVYRGDRPFPSLKGKTVLLVDDGLASGFTMMAAVKSVRNGRPARIVVAVPVSPYNSAELVRPLVDDLVSLVIARTWSFAVASYYRDWYDLSDDEVVQYLRQGMKDSPTGAPEEETHQPAAQ